MEICKLSADLCPLLESRNLGLSRRMIAGCCCWLSCCAPVAVLVSAAGCGAAGGSGGGPASHEVAGWVVVCGFAARDFIEPAPGLDGRAFLAFKAKQPRGQQLFALSNSQDQTLLNLDLVALRLEALPFRTPLGTKEASALHKRLLLAISLIKATVSAEIFGLVEAALDLYFQ